MKLTAQMEMFCREYVTSFNGREAARKAGYSHKTAHVSASRLLDNPRVQAYIAGLQKPRFEKLEVTADRIIEEFARIAFNSPKKFFDAKGNLIQVADLDDDAAAALASLESFEEYQGHGEDRVAIGMVRKLKFWDKVQALNSLAKLKAMFPDTNVKLSGTVTNRVVGLAQIMDEIDGADTGVGPSSPPEV